MSHKVMVEKHPNITRSINVSGEYSSQTNGYTLRNMHCCSNVPLRSLVASLCCQVFIQALHQQKRDQEMFGWHHSRTNNRSSLLYMKELSSKNIYLANQSYRFRVAEIIISTVTSLSKGTCLIFSDIGKFVL